MNTVFIFDEVFLPLFIKCYLQSVSSIIYKVLFTKCVLNEGNHEADPAS